jgi:hypothetical protein
MSDVDYTVLFHGHPRKIKENPFDLETPFGKVVVIGVSNAFEDADCFRTALEEIAEGHGKEAAIAKAALDERDAALQANLKAGRGP